MLSLICSSKGFGAEKLTSGTIDPARLPNSARYEEVVVQNDSERFALTTWANVKNKPIEFTPEKHAASHGAGGSDPITPQSIGALPVGGKAGSAGAADTVPWSGVANKPNEFNPTPLGLIDK